jgi:hypothetical protein
MARYYRVTKEFALEEIRRFAKEYPISPPEIPAIGLMRRIDSWEEHSAVLKALDEFLAEQR